MAKKKNYMVRVAYKVCEYYEVKATNEEDAIEQALEKASEDSLNDFIQIGDGEGIVTQINGKSVEPKKPEPESVYLVKQESNVDGELHFNVVPCKDMETAKRVLAEEVNTLLAESPKYKDAKRWIDGDDTLNYDDCPYSWENDKDDAFYISCTCDDYHELITIEEKEIN